MKRINVKAFEKALVFKNGKLIDVLTDGKHWIGFGRTVKRYDVTELFYHESELDQLMQNDKFANMVDITIVKDNEIMLQYKDGLFHSVLTPGGSQNAVIKKVDLRKQQIEISGQELLTKDKAAIRVNFQAGYAVTDVNKAIDETKDYTRQLYVLIQLGIREYVGQYSLDELLANKQSAAPYIMQYAKAKALDMGVELLSCGIRDIILPGDVREIMNQVLIAEKKAQANVIMRREETASTRSLLNTAKLMEDNEMLFRLKEMEYMEKISEKVGEISLNGGNQAMDQLRTLVGYKP